jgi:hypothetical protein
MGQGAFQNCQSISIVFAWDEHPHLWLHDGGMPPPIYERIFKLKTVKMKDRSGKYGKLYL